jgi:hypothetical protein
MDLNPREAVVDQESSHTPGQEEEPTAGPAGSPPPGGGEAEAPIYALSIAEQHAEAVMDCLNRLEAELGEEVFLAEARRRVVTSKGPPVDWDWTIY